MQCQVDQMEFFSPKRSLSVFISFDIFKCHGVLDIVECWNTGFAEMRSTLIDLATLDI